MTQARAPRAILVAALLISGCTPSSPGPSPSAAQPATSPAAACMRNLPAPGRVVAAMGGQDRGALLLVTSGGPGGVVNGLSICRWEHSAAGFVDTDGTGGGNDMSVPTTISVDRAVTTAIAPIEHALGGRVALQVAAVKVTLSDGSGQDAVISSGYWIAWWTGQGPAAVAALDASGTRLSETPFTAESR